MILFLKILGGILALGIGLYFGSAGQYRPSSEEVDKALEPGGSTHRVKRRFTLFGWLRRTDERSSHIRRRQRGRSNRRFDLVVPETKKEKELRKGSGKG